MVSRFTEGPVSGSPARIPACFKTLVIPRLAIFTVIKNGSGPTAILTGANHGDEYEGPIALWGMTHTMKADDVSGRVVMVPAMNYPAFNAGKRTSWIDGGNMNRVFPGNPEGTITEIIADYFSRTLLPMADYVIDIHSGGKTMEFLPFGAAHILDDKDQQSRCVAAVQAFNAPYTLMLLEPDAAHLYDTAAENQGKSTSKGQVEGDGSVSGPFCSIHAFSSGLQTVPCM